MNKKYSSMDGFTPRRVSTDGNERPVISAGSLSKLQSTPKKPQVVDTSEKALVSTGSTGIARRGEISESLKGIDLESPKNQKLSRREKKKANKKPASRRRKTIKYVVLFILVVLLAIGGYMGYKALNASGSIFKGNIFDAVLKNEPLKEDANGRSNILVIGTSEDDPGHQGADLTDSIMILSIDQDQKNAYMISIPRDMEVEYGQACPAGYRGKINAYFSCVKEGDSIEQDRAATMEVASLLGKATALDIQYGVHVNYTVMRDLVNALGGITVTIESRNPNGQMDSNFDWKCGATLALRKKNCPPNGHFIDYPNGLVNLDAEHALYLAQARGDTAPTYGFEQSNFDREKNQQKIIKAIREKAVSAGVVSDPAKVNGIIDALGNNLRATFEAKEVRTLLSLASDIKSENIQSISLIDGDSPVMNGTGNPTAGAYNFTALQAFIKQSLSSNPITRENAKVAVLNGSGTAGVAQAESQKLVDAGLVTPTIGNAPSGAYEPVEIYQITTTKTATKTKLESLYSVKVKTTAPAFSVATGVDYVIVIGQAPAAAASAAN